MGNEYRLTPAMSSRKLQVVGFVLSYRERWGRAPSYRQIDVAMDIPLGTARDAIRRAIRDQLLQRIGPQRELVAGPAWQPSAEQLRTMIAQLQAMGFVTLPPAGAEACKLYPLPVASELEHIAPDEGEA